MTVLIRGATTEDAAKVASGANAHAEGSVTTASGPASHAEGFNTTASTSQAHAEGTGTSAAGVASHAEGSSTTATGSYAHAEGSGTIATSAGTAAHAEGTSTTASGASSHAEGQTTTASGVASHAAGIRGLASRVGQYAQGGGYFTATGDIQRTAMVYSAYTTDATPTVMATNGVVTITGTNTNVLTIPVNRAHQFRISAAARREDVSGTFAGWEFTGLMVRDTGNARFVGDTVARAWGDAAAAAWDVTLSINTGDATNNYLAITATGEAGQTIRWVAAIYTTEVG